MASNFDIVVWGPTIRLTITNAVTVIKLSAQPNTRRRFDLHVVSGALRGMQGNKAATVSADTTNDLTNGKLGRRVTTTVIWPVDHLGRPDTQYLALVRDGSTNAVVELTMTDSTDSTDLPAVV